MIFLFLFSVLRSRSYVRQCQYTVWATILRRAVTRNTPPRATPRVVRLNDSKGEQNCRPGYDFHQFTYPYSQLLAHLSFFSPRLGLLAYAWVRTIVNFSANALVSPHTCIRQRETHRAPHNTSTRTGLFGDDDVEIARLERGYSGSSFISIVESVDCRVQIIVD